MTALSGDTPQAVSALPRSSAKRSGRTVALRLVLVALLFVLMAAAVFFPPARYYPSLDLSVSGKDGQLSMHFTFEARPSAGECDRLLGSIVRQYFSLCRECRIDELKCSTNPDIDDRLRLSVTPLNLPSARMPEGVVSFSANQTMIADAACQIAAQRSGREAPMVCYPPGTTRHLQRPVTMNAVHAALLLGIATVAAWIGCWLIIRNEHLHARFSHDAIDSGPQKMHEVPTPRIGGLSILLAMLSVGGLTLLTYNQQVDYEYSRLMLAAIPAFLGGLIEDVSKRVGVAERLLLTMLSGAAAAWWLGLVVNRLELPLIDALLVSLPFAVLFTSFAVGGVANAINIIDGYNGLASGYGMIVALALAFAAYRYGDMLVFVGSLAMAGALIGFLCWNWPHGRVFLGDGGAYFIGFWLAEMALLLTLRHPTVSPWFAACLLLHPITETLFSMIRRRFFTKATTGAPDALHLHQLLQKALCCHRLPANNAAVAPWIWAAGLATALAALVLIETGWGLRLLAISYIGLYTLCYVGLWRVSDRACASATLP